MQRRLLIFCRVSRHIFDLQGIGWTDLIKRDLKSHIPRIPIWCTTFLTVATLVRIQVLGLSRVFFYLCFFLGLWYLHSHPTLLHADIADLITAKKIEFNTRWWRISLGRAKTQTGGCGLHVRALFHVFSGGRGTQHWVPRMTGDSHIGNIPLWKENTIFCIDSYWVIRPSLNEPGVSSFFSYIGCTSHRFPSDISILVVSLFFFFFLKIS